MLLRLGRRYILQPSFMLKRSIYRGGAAVRGGHTSPIPQMMLARKERHSEKQRSFMLKRAAKIAVDLESTLKTRMSYLQKKNDVTAEGRDETCRRK